MVQDCDSVGYGLPDELTMELFKEVESFRYLKIEVVQARLKYSKILQLVEGHIHKSDGSAVTQMIEGMRRGDHAFMPTGMHFIYTKIFENFTTGIEKDA